MYNIDIAAHSHEIDGHIMYFCQNSRSGQISVF